MDSLFKLIVNGRLNRPELGLNPGELPLCLKQSFTFDCWASHMKRSKYTTNNQS